MRRFLLSLLAVLSIALSARSAAVVVLSEGFENGIPSTWKDTVVSYASTPFLWEVETNSTVAPSGAAEGVYRVALRNTANRSKVCVTRLITPVMNCAVYQPRVIFAHAQPVKGTSNFDKLKVYYRTSETADWTLLQEYNSRIDLWQYDTLDLIEANNTYQLAFEGNINNGNGVVIDDVTVSAAPQCTEVQTIGVVAMANSAELTIGADLSAESFQVAISSEQITDLENFNPAQTASVVYYNPLLEDWTEVVNGLQPKTDYYAYVRSACSDMVSGYTAWVEQAFRTSLGFPMEETFDNGIPGDWKRKQSKLEDAYAGTPLRDHTSTSYGWQRGTNTTLTGSTHVYAYAYNYTSSSTPATYDPFWLVSPGIDLVNVPADTAVEMTLNLMLTSGSTSSSAVSASSVSSLQFTVLVSEDDGQSWAAANATVWSASALAAHPITDINGVLKRVRINMNRYKGKVIRLAFIAYTNSTTGYFHMDDVSIHSYDAMCGDVQKITAMPDVNSLTATWVISGKENAVVELATSADFTTDVQTVNITTGTTYTFTNLTENTQYYVRVKQDCPDAEWVSTSCRTAVGLPYLNPFTDTTIPADWTRHTGVSLDDVLNGMALPAPVTSGWSYTATATTAFPGMTDGRVYASMSSTNRYWFVSPNIRMNDTSNDPLRLSFMLVASKATTTATAPDFSDNDDAFAILISEDAGLTWTAANATIWDCDPNTTNLKLNTFSEVPQRITVDMTAYRNKSIKIALYSGSTSSGASNYIIISNLSVNTYDASCGGVRNLNLNVSSISATATWTAVGNQNVNVQLSEVSDFSELIDTLSLSTSTAQFTGLTPHTRYYVRVRQACSTDDVDWAVASFTTPYGVPFSEYFTGSGVPTDWARYFGIADSVIAGKAQLTTSTSSQRYWTKSSSLGTQYLQIYQNSTYDCNGWLVTPNLDMTGAGQTAQLSFNVALSGSTSSMTSPTSNATDNTFMVLGSTDDGATWFILRDWRNDGTTADRFSDIPNELTRTVVNLSQYTSGNLRLAFYGGTNSGVSGLYVHINKVQVKSYDPNCQGVESVRAIGISGDGATIEWVAGGMQSVDLKVATDTSFTQLVFNQTVTAATQLTNLNSNTVYYIKARQSCDTEGEWMKAQFKTHCAAVTPAEFGTETFDNINVMECWTLGYMDEGTTPSTSSGRATVTGFGNVLRLAKSSANTTSTTYADRAYAISPELNVDSISKYQIVFNAATNNTAATNIARVFVGVATDPADLGSVEHIKTLNLNLAADSNAMATYVVSFADYEGDYDGNYGRYIIFVADAAPDSTNHVLIDNVLVEQADGCQMLIETAIDTIATDLARLTWENIGSTSYEVMVSVFGGRADTITASSIAFQGTTQTNSILINNLSGNTRYYAYVRSVCTDGAETHYSRWSSARRFKTLCTSVSQYPWTEGFEDYEGGTYSTQDGAVPDCWDVATTNAVAPHVVSNLVDTDHPYAHSGNNALSFYGAGTQYAALPPFNTPINSLEMTFYVRMESATTGVLTLGYITPNDNNYDSFTEIEVIESCTGSAMLREATLSAVPANASRLVFRWVTGSTWYLCSVDDITIQPAPECRKPAITSLDATLDSVHVVWAPTEALSYTVEISDDQTFAAMIDSVVVTDTVYGFNHLSPSTNYYIRVRSNCADNDVSDWSSVRQVKTALGIPYLENFEVSTWPSDWGRFQGSPEDAFAGSLPSSTTLGWGINTTDYGLPHNKARVNIYNSGNNRWMVTPVIAMSNLVAGDSLAFAFDFAYTDWNNGNAPDDGSDQSLWVLVSTDGGATWPYANSYVWSGSDTAATTFPIADIPTDGVHLTLDFSRFVGADTLQIAFVATSKSGDNDFHIDNVSLRKVMSDCSDPTNLEVSDINKISAMLTWQGDSMKPTVVQLATASDFSTGVRYDTVASGLSYMLTGLTHSTNYFVRVKQICATDVTAYTGAVAFGTECETITEFPWTETFEGYPTGVDMPIPCWISELYQAGTGSTGTTGKSFNINSSTILNNATNKLCLPDMMSGTKTQLTLPPMMIPVEDGYELLFDICRNATSYDQEGLRFYVSPTTSVDDAIELGFVSRNYSVADTTAGIPAEENSGWYTYSFTIPMSGVCHIIVMGESQYGSATYSDNYIVRAVPTCPKVKQVTVSNIETHSAVASIEATNAAEYEYVLTQRLVAEPDSASIIRTIVTDHTSNVVLDSLQSATTYYLYVRGLCDSTDMGEWSKPVAFVTACEPYALPYSEDFESDLPCWSAIPYVSYSTSYPYIGSTASNANSGSHYVYFYGGTSSTEQILILPTMNYPANLLKVSFYSRASYTTDSYGDLIVGAMSDPTDKTTFMEAGRTTKNTTYTYFEQSLTSLPATHKYVAIKYAGGTSSQATYLDDIQVSLAVNVNEGIFGVSSSNITTKSFDIAIQANPDTAICHNYELVISNTALTDSVLDTIAKIQLGSSTTYSVTGLTRETSYYYYVRTACDTTYGRWFSEAVTTKGLVNCEDLVIGNGTSTTYAPVCGYYGYERHGYIYTPEDGLTPGMIQSIGWRISSGSYTIPARIFLKQTTDTEFTTAFSWNSIIGDATLVYEGDITTSIGWITIPITTFNYTGGNLMVLVESNATGSGSKTVNAYYTTSSNSSSAFYIRKDTSIDDDQQYSDFYSTAMNGERHDVTFGMCHVQDPCPAVTNLTATLTGRGATTATLSWTAATGETLQDYDVYVGTVNPATLDSVPETYTALTDTTLALNNLTPATNYYAAVRANCNAEDGNSTWAVVDFTTYATCPAIENLVVTPLSKTAVTATWEFGGPQLDTVFYYVLSATDSVDWSTAQPLQVNALTLDLTGLTAGQTYWLYVAQNCTTENSEYVSTTFTMPAACIPVENLTATPAHNLVKLAWTRAAFGFETEWEVGLVGGETQIVSEPKALFYGLNAHTRYTAYVRAICSETEMSDSLLVSFITANEPQPCVAIGEAENITYSAPIDNFYNNAAVQTIYTAEQIAQAGRIESIQYNCTITGDVDLTLDELKIYMAHTTMDVAEETTSWVPQSEATLVYSATNYAMPVTDGPLVFTLQTPFQYNGTDNLAIIITHKATAYDGDVKFYYTAGLTGVTMYRQSDSDAAAGDYPATSSSTATVTPSTYLPDITICFPYEPCMRPQEVTVDNVTATGATVSWLPGGHETSWNTYLSSVAMSDAALETAAYDTVTSFTKALTGLTDDTDYHFYVRSICDSATTSSWVDATFTTVAICVAPNGLQVDSVTNSEAFISWSTSNEGFNDASYEVAYGLSATFDLTLPATYQIVPATGTSIALSGLSANSRYTFAVREVCDATYTSRWSQTAGFLTDCGVVSQFPWVEDFEDYATGTLAISCWSNQHVEGTGTSLFLISSATQDNNSTKKLNLPDMAAGTKTQLTLPTMYIDEADNYEFDIDVYRNSSYANKTDEGLRIYVSTDGTLTNATQLAFIPRVYNVMDTVSGIIPAEAVAGWYTYELNIPVSDTIQIIVVGESQYGQATYADNFRVRRQPTCKRPMIERAETTDTSVELVWMGGNDRDYRVEYDVVADFSTKQTVSVAADTTVTITGLTPASTYYFRVKGVCGDTAVSDYSTVVKAVTAYVLPFTESYSSTSLPDNWNRLQGDITANAKAATSGWNFSSSSSNYFAYSTVYSSTSTDTRYTLATPGIMLNTTEPGVRLSFDMSLASSYSGSTAPTASVCAGREFSIVVSTDEGATWTKVRTWSDTDYVAIPVDGRNYKIDLSNYVAQKVLVGFYHSAGTSTSSSNSCIRLDNVVIAGYDNTCAGIEDLNVINPSTNGTVVTWSYGPGSQDAVVVVSTAATTDSAVVWTDTIRNAATVTLPTMPMSSTIHVFVKQYCGGDNESAWSEVSFDTPIGVPYHPVFTSSTLPNGWTRSSTTATDVFAGTAMNVSAGSDYPDFKYTAGDVVMNYGHFKSNVYGSSCHHWLVTPLIDMTPNVGQGVMISFDLSLCDYGNPGQAADPVGSDDQFMVVVSEDGGNTWSRSNATVWQDEVGADYSYTAIPSATAQTYRIDLSRYTGKVIRIGFYTESTVTGGDNDLHLGNIHVEQVDANMYADTICDGFGYQNHGFTITADMYEIGTNTFSYYTPATQTTPAVLDVLTLEVMAIQEKTINATVCEGAAYSYDENIYVEEGEVVPGEQTVTFYLTSANDCDSIVYLVINGLPASHTTEYAETCSGIPYNWHGQDYYLSGTYVDSLRTIEGCDSICTLLLTVQERLHSDTAVTLCYGDQLVINGQTVTTSGIYTEYIDNPDGCDEELAWHVTAVGKLESHKRVIACTGTTYSDDLIQGLTQDYHGSTVTTSKVSGCDSTVIIDIWFADPSKTVYVDVPVNELPLVINGVEVVAAGTSEGEYNRTVETDCGTINVVVTVGQAVIRYNVTVKAENGLAYGSGVYVAGEQVEIRVQPFEGYRFKSWNDGNTDNPRTITVNADVTYTGTCEIIEGLEEVIRDMNEDDVLKLIENQQLIIIRGGVRYNAQGAVIE